MELSNRKKWLIGGALVLVAFLIALVMVKIKNQPLSDRLPQKEQALTKQAVDLQKQLAASRERLRLARLNNQIGILMLMTEDKNFGEAREGSTRFFDELRQFT